MYVVDGINVASGYHTITTLHTIVTVNFNTSSQMKDKKWLLQVTTVNQFNEGT